MFIWCQNSARRILPNARPGREDSPVLSLHCGKNMSADGQILLRSLQPFEITGAELVNLSGISADAIALQRVENVTYNDGIPYPDRLVPQIPCSVPAHCTQGLWLTVNVAAGTPAGSASFTVLLHTSEGDYTATVLLQIYDVTLPDPDQGSFEHEYFFDIGSNKEYHTAAPVYSQAWWERMRQYALAMKTLRVNSLYVPYKALLAGEGTARVDDTHWTFCFDRLDAFVEHFLTWGSFKRITFNATLATLEGKELWGINYPGVDTCYVPGTDECRAYAESLFTAIYAHFREKGWLDLLTFHLNDEPHETENWLWLHEIVSRCAPGVPCSEPLDMYDSALALAGKCNIFVPRLEVYEQGRDYFNRRQKAGDTVWVYSCCFPEEPWFLNKFIDLPHHYARLIHWACYACGITGFLHWGFNFWGPSFYGLNADARFKGDGFIVYPDCETGGVLPSVRGMATRAGIEEYELLKAAEKQHPEAARALALSLTRSFSDFQEDPDALEAAHIRLLTLAEKA